jgi:hypothetical protein
MQLACVPPWHVDEFWPKASRFVNAAAKRAHLRTPEGLKTDVHSGSSLLWVAMDGRRVVGAGVTERHKDSCWIIAWGADDQKQCASLLSTIEDFARQQGCKSVRLCGRRGWERMLPDYRTKAIVMEKVL